MALAALAGVLEGACFPPAGWWPLAFVALAPLVRTATGGGPLEAAGLGWLAGTVAASIAITPWITVATERYFTLGTPGALLFATAVGQVFHALPAAAFAAAVTRLARLPAAPWRVLSIAAAWTAIELGRSRALTGAPWDLLGHALYRQPLWMQLADVGGVFAVSFVLAATAAALAERRRAALLTAAALLASAAAYGAWRLGAEDDGGPALRVALVQGNVPNAWRSAAARADDAFAAFADTTRPLLGARPALVVWSENAVSFVLEPNQRFREAAARLLGPGGPPLLLGAPRHAQVGDGRVAFFNSAWLLGADGGLRGVYDKRRLVPFAEYAPVPRLPLLGWRFDAPGDYAPGATARVFPEPAPFGVLVCYEAIYPGLARDLVAAGARFLVNVSNDAWFGTAAGLEQHLASAVFRSVETRRALARGTNTGVTVLVGPSGRILQRFPQDVRGGWVVDVPLREGSTLYTRYGDVFAGAMAVAVLAALALVRPGPGTGGATAVASRPAARGRPPAG